MSHSSFFTVIIYINKILYSNKLSTQIQPKRTSCVHSIHPFKKPTFNRTHEKAPKSGGFGAFKKHPIIEQSLRATQMIRVARKFETVRSRSAQYLRKSSSNSYAESIIFFTVFQDTDIVYIFAFPKHTFRNHENH